MSMFNSEQEDYMRSLAEMPDKARCYCGWYPVGECLSVYNCDTTHKGKTFADHKHDRDQNGANDHLFDPEQNGEESVR